jgi:hypothetical protein
MAIFAKAISTVRTPPIMALIHQELVAILTTCVRLHFFLTRIWTLVFLAANFDQLPTLAFCLLPHPLQGSLCWGAVGFVLFQLLLSWEGVVAFGTFELILVFLVALVVSALLGGLERLRRVAAITTIMNLT